ncbi:hypothetical protein ACHAPE_003946 [Trichoderma viride]
MSSEFDGCFQEILSDGLELFDFDAYYGNGNELNGRGFDSNPLADAPSQHVLEGHQFNELSVAEGQPATLPNSGQSE